MSQEKAEKKSKKMAVQIRQDSVQIRPQKMAVQIPASPENGCQDSVQIPQIPRFRRFRPDSDSPQIHADS